VAAPCYWRVGGGVGALPVAAESSGRPPLTVTVAEAKTASRPRSEAVAAVAASAVEAKATFEQRTDDGDGYRLRRRYCAVGAAVHRRQRPKSSAGVALKPSPVETC